MDNQKVVVEATATRHARAVESVLRHFTERGQLKFRAYMEGRGFLV